MTKQTCKSTWGTSVGQDCISLDTSLCRWLGERLLFLSEHTQSHPFGWEYEKWKATLEANGQHLLVWADRSNNDVDEAQAYAEAQGAMRWVAEHLGHLWD